MNRLAGERSPYLLQHAHNPVEWYPWSDEAFEKSRVEEKPIFLSIGYSTCHWCHVMERESFENGDVAAVLNEHFVSIKVDREERPDIDRVYMSFVQQTTGGGGWPMSVWLTPELKPFYGGTYFPPSSRWGRPGFIDILQEIARVWRVERDKVSRSAEAIASGLRAAEGVAPAPSLPGLSALAWTGTQFEQAFDRRHGGFGDAPKFPRPSELLFLLREHARTGAAGPRDMVLRTLTAMALGGVRDHVGGGFHRYSVDAEWRVPHFEKMLYDQAQLVLTYVEASQVSGDPFYLDVADDTLRYVMREMTGEQGGFYSAEDADSIPPEQAEQPGAHKSEGAFYLWTASEIDALLGDDAPVVRRRFGIEAGGNAPSDPQQEFTGKNLLYVAKSVDDLAVEQQTTSDEIEATLSRSRLKMFRARLGRPRPHLDDKILTAWNGLMIAAFARAARLVGAHGDDTTAGKPYLDAARRAASFIRRELWNGSTRTLLRRYRDGRAEIDGFAEDYAFLIFGLLELFQTDPDPEWITWAIALQRRQDELFRDRANGGWFSTTGSDPTVLVRMKDEYDGAEPAASSISVMNLLTLSHLVEDAGWQAAIEEAFRLFGSRLEQAGRAVPMMAAALSTYIAGPQQLVIVGEGADALRQAVRRRYLPFACTIAVSAAEQQTLQSILPFVGAMKNLDGMPAAYLCRNFSCRPPVTTVADLERALAS
jgi:uncharacterized protein YyaL (SSP411 family)